mgnify:FL=1
MQLPNVLEAKGLRVLTTKQLSEMYETDVKTIQYNFRYNKNKYVLGKHYIEVHGEELRRLKTRNEFHSSLKYAKSLYLWTEKGALLHAKSLNTDKAWQVYDYLLDFYFRAKETKSSPKKEVVPTKTKVEPFKKDTDIPEMNNPLGILKILLNIAEEKGITVTSYPFQKFNSALKNKTVGVRNGLTLEKTCYEIAWELSHIFIHYDNGNMIQSPLAKDYNDQATRAAEMLIKALDTKVR